MSLPSLSHIKGEGFNSTKDSHPLILERRSRILAKLSLRELNDSTISGIYTFEIMAISLSLKRDKNHKGRLWVHETPILEVMFVTLTENSSVITYDTQGHTSMRNMALKLPRYFYLLMEKPLSYYFQVPSPYHPAVQHAQKKR